jgi:transcriptional regulator with XRE-family HTH domain
MSTGIHSQKPLKIVGSFIRQRRESIGLSQRALGLKFTPPVTTQFISNVERGVTPLPPSHIPTLTQALLVSEDELRALLEKEFTAKLSQRLGKEGGLAEADALPSSEVRERVIRVQPQDHDFLQRLYDAYRKAGPSTQTAFHTVCESILGLAPTSTQRKAGESSE